MANADSESIAGNFEVARAMVRTAVLGSFASQLRKSDLSPKPSMEYDQYSAGPDWAASFCSAMRSKFAHTASALNSVPSENFTPSRRVKVHVLPSSLGSQDSASPGPISALPGLTSTSPSKI